ncbi:hypothetical protein M422DRAFT_775360 [Sphaerobolus stellatus SS14]|nr:hypothetical protein M422DRAFT_775360 [Sphaerobolus stellatus SS14]
MNPDPHQAMIAETSAYIQHNHNYQPPIPELDNATWMKVADWDSTPGKKRNQELEWIGDSYIAVAMSFEIEQRFPRLDSGTHYAISNALTCNFTFAHLYHKLNITARLVSPEGAPTWSWNLPMADKHFADAFEVVIAEIVETHGFEGLRMWTHRVFEPLLDIAYNAFCSIKRQSIPSTKVQPHPSKKTSTSELLPKTMLLGKKQILPRRGRRSKGAWPLPSFPVQPQMTSSGTAYKPIFTNSDDDHKENYKTLEGLNKPM